MCRFAAAGGGGAEPDLPSLRVVRVQCQLFPHPTYHFGATNGNSSEEKKKQETAAVPESKLLCGIFRAEPDGC